MTKGSVQPQPFEYEIKENMAKIRLTKNVTEIVNINPFTKLEDKLYEYDEIMVLLRNRPDLNAYISTNFDALWNLGVEQKRKKDEIEANKRQMHELVNNYAQIRINMQLDKNINLLENQTNVNLKQAEAEIEITKRIDSGEINSDTFNNLSVEEQNLVKLILFKRYSPTQEQAPRTFSAIEFALVAIIKLMAKGLDRNLLSVEENVFLDDFVNNINLNDMSISDTNDWRYKYFVSEFTNVQTNRQEYFNTKLNITGSI